MAKSSDKQGSSGAKAASGPNMLIVFLVLTLLGAGGGAGFAMMVLNAQNNPQQQTTEVPAADKRMIVTSRFPPGSVEVPIKPVVVNAGQDRPRMLRLEGSLILAANTQGQELLKSEIEEDIVAFLKGVSIDESIGVRGFQNLREDLDDRIKIRGRGAVLGFLISGFVFE